MDGSEESSGPGANGVLTVRGSAAELHDLDLLARPAGVWRLDPDAPAVVLGSGQPDEMVDRGAAAGAGIEVCRRRSGGGLVWVDRDDCVWIDVVLARDGARWDDDVHRAAEQLGDVWAAALRSVGLDADVHRGAMTGRELGSIVCFAGVGAGEVTVDGRKAVGISQRRDRRGARFQCVLYRSWEPERLMGLLGSAASGMAEPIWEQLTHGVVALPEIDEVLDEVIGRLSAHSGN